MRRAGSASPSPTALHGRSVVGERGRIELRAQARECLVYVHRQWQLSLNPPGLGFYVEVDTVTDIVIPHTVSSK